MLLLQKIKQILPKTAKRKNKSSIRIKKAKEMLLLEETEEEEREEAWQKIKNQEYLTVMSLEIELLGH